MNASATQPVASLLTGTEQRRAARQLTLAMLALGLLALGLAWRWLMPAQVGVSQLLLGVASLLVAVPVMRSAWYSLRYPSLHGITDQLIAVVMPGMLLTTMRRTRGWMLSGSSLVSCLINTEAEAGWTG